MIGRLRFTKNQTNKELSGVKTSYEHEFESIVQFKSLSYHAEGILPVGCIS